MTAPDRTRPPATLPTPSLALPTFRERVLDGGLRVRVARMPRLPEVAIRLVLDAGAGAEDPGEAGVAALAARVLPEGAAGRTAPGMAEWLDHLGAGFSAGVSHDSVQLGMHALSDTVDEALDYLAAVVLAPAFFPEEVERVRDERIDEILRLRDDPAEVAAEALAAVLFGAHPYGRPVGGTEVTLSRLGSAGVRAFWERTYGARSAVLVAAGDIDPDGFAAAAATRFGAWAPGAEPGRVAPSPEPLPGPIHLIDRPGSRQSEIRVGTVGLARGAPDEAAALVMNAVLGGLFSSRLNLNLREDKGWTYGVRSGFTRRREAGPFVVRAAVETEKTARGFEEVLAEIRSMTERPPDEEELALARSALKLSLPREFETTSLVASKEAERIAYGLPEDWWERFPSAVTAVGRDDVVAVAERYLEPARLRLLAVADAAATQAGLAGLGPVEVSVTP
jgi:zinc protease